MTDKNNAAQAVDLANRAREWAMQRGSVENFPATARAHIRGLADALLSKLRAEGVQAGEPVDQTLAAHTDLLTYVLQTDVHNRLTPRVIDIAYTAFVQAKQPNAEDGGASDWFNDTKPVVTRVIAKLRDELFADRAKKAAALASAPVVEPPGWRMVPEQPTHEMIKAWHDAYSKSIKSWRSSRAYVAMLDAAPKVSAPAPVAGEAQPANITSRRPSGVLSMHGASLHMKPDGSGEIIVAEDDFTLEDDRDEGPNGPQGSVHWVARLPASEIAALRDFLTGHARPSDDDLWDQTLAERDEYHDIADKLSNAIADHLLVEIGEHSSSNCPWRRALEAIENAAPQASEAVRNARNAASEDHMRPDLDRGVPGSFTAFSQWVMNQPNDQIYVHSAQEGFLAGVEWSRQQRTGVCLPEYLNDLRYHDQYRIGWNRCLEVCRAALSAQPGAQHPKQHNDGGADE